MAGTGVGSDHDGTSCEIYAPPNKRKYGYYVLPLLYHDNFIGRLEAVADKKTETLTVKNVWFESGVKQNKRLKTAVDNCMVRFAKFNECNRISLPAGCN